MNLLLPIRRKSEGLISLYLPGIQADVSAALGFWALVGGFLMLRKVAAGCGMGLVVLSVMALTGIS
jgi:hypothetical protein